MGYIYLVVFAATGALMVIGGIIASNILAPSRPTPEKASPYECGEKTIGSSWVQFNVGYYLFALVFLIFEIETAFLFPCAALLKELGTTALIEVGIFVGILLVGLAYAWRKGVLEWA